VVNKYSELNADFHINPLAENGLVELIGGRNTL
jgi:hypothetical protein